MNTRTFILFFLILALLVTPVFADSEGTATVGGDEESSPLPPGTKTEPVVFDLFVMTPNYIILPFSSKITTSIDVYNRVSSDSEVMFVWTIWDSKNLQVKNGSFLYLILGYQQITLDVEVSAPSKEGDYTLQIDVPEIDVTGASTHPFHVYGILSFLFGPGWWLALLIVTICAIVFLGWLLYKKHI